MKKGNILISAIALLMVSVVALTAASFAWFNFSDVVNVDKIKTNVVTGTSITMSTEYDKNYVNYITETRLTSSGAMVRPVPKEDKENSGRLNAATPVYTDALGKVLKIENNKLVFKTSGAPTPAESAAGALYGLSNANVSAPDATTGDMDVITIKLYIQSNKSVEVSATSLDKLFDNSGSTFTPDISTLKSLRIAYVFEKYATYAGDAYTKLASSDPDTQGYKIFAPDTVVNDGVKANLDPDQRQKAKTALADANLYGEEDEMFYDAYEFDASREGLSDPDGDTSMYLFDLNYGEVYEINIHVWIEGFDIDCNGFSAGDEFYTSLQFSGSAKVETFEVRFEADDADDYTTVIQNVAAGSAPTLPAVPVKTGKDFLGWYIDGEDEGELYGEGLLAFPVVSEPVTYVAKFG